MNQNENNEEIERVEEPQLPKTICVFWNNDLDEFWLSAEESTEACAVKGEVRLVGVYELKSKLQVSLEVHEDLIVKQV
jgi:hypothetical protein